MLTLTLFMYQRKEDLASWAGAGYRHPNKVASWIPAWSRGRKWGRGPAIDLGGFQ